MSVSPDPDPAAGNPFAYAADEPLDLVDPTGHYIVPPPNAGTSERIGNGVSSPSNFVADVATARVVEHAVITAPNNAAKAAAAHAALARVEAEQATAHRAAVAAAQAEARRQAAARAARAAAARNQVKKKPASSTNNGYSGCVRFGCTDATAVNDDSPGQETPGGWQGFLGGIGSFIIGTAESAACSGIGELSCQAYRDAGGEMPSTLYKNWLSSQGVDTSFNSTYGAGEVTAGIALFAIGAGEADAEDLAAACAGGESFTPGTPVLLADRKSIPISDLKPGDKVLATNTKTGKTSPETVAAVLVHHDTDLYNLTIRSNGRTEVIHTTSNHLFWDPSLNYGWIPAKQLKPGMHLKTPDGQPAVVVGGSVPAAHEGWMWDLTVPGNNDHDFYVLASGEGAGQPSTGIRHVYNAIAADTSVLVHNCDEGGIETSFSPKQLQSKFKHAADFGIDGNYNPSNGQAFGEAIDQFVDSSGTVTKPGTYRGTPSLLTYNPESRLVVVRSSTGAFVSGWRMSPAQLSNVIERGALGGG